MESRVPTFPAATMMEPSYVLLAIRGVQAGREYYSAMCPLKLIPKLFLFDEEEVPSQMRAQRQLNRSRVPEIARYLVDNPTEYVFSSITASIDGPVLGRPAEECVYLAGIYRVSVQKYRGNAMD
jgi:DNA sulfur modification protein DndB